MARMNFEEFIKFDKNNLKERLRMLPSFIYYYGRQENKLVDEIELLVTKLAIVKSTLAVQTRTKHRNIKAAILKSETAVKDVVTCSEEVKELEAKLNDLNKALRLSKLRMKTLTALADSMTQYGHYVRLEKKQSKI